MMIERFLVKMDFKKDLFLKAGYNLNFERSIGTQTEDLT